MAELQRSMAAGAHEGSLVSEREARLQAAVLRGERLLLLEVLLDNGPRFWLLPGGGREPDDADDFATIVREVREELGLEVVVDRQLLDVAAHRDDPRYRRYRTFLCHAAGHSDPVVGTRDGVAQITKVQWLSLTDIARWGDDVRTDRFLYPQLLAIRRALGLGDRADV